MVTSNNVLESFFIHGLEGKNKKVLENKQNQNTPTETPCNCRNKNECPMQGRCLEKSVVYQAKVVREENNKIETYVGLCATTFKDRLYNHRTSFNNVSKRHQTELSNYIWELKEKNIPFKISWKIIQKAKAYSNITKRCNLCIAEKFNIICKPDLCSLNKRNELATNCKHTWKYLLSN